MRVLVIDNYDSFVYTLNGYLQELGAQTEVILGLNEPGVIYFHETMREILGGE